MMWKIELQRIEQTATLLSKLCVPIHNREREKVACNKQPIHKWIYQ